MKTSYSRCASRLKQQGFTSLELAVVVTLISILGVMALGYYYKLLVDVERTAMEQDLGAIRSAISMQFAGYYVAGDMVGLENLIGSNPMDLLAEKPRNYLGVINHYKLEELEKGSWFFDSQSQMLIYLVRNQLYFEPSLEGAPRARFKVLPIYSDRKQGEGIKKYISGLTLKSLEPYRWLRPWG